MNRKENLNLTDPENSCTPLHHAARFGYKEVVIWLIEHGADVNAAAYNGFTPLHLTERREIAELLIKASAKLDQLDTWKKSALQYAAETRNQEVVEAILASGYKLDLSTALQLKQRDAALRMLVHDPEAIVGGEGKSDLHGNVTPLGIAAAQGDLELVRLLIEAGAPINDPTDCVRFGGSATPLCNAVWAGKTAVVEFLLQQGAATNVVGGKFERSISEYAARHSDKKIVELLTKYKENPGTRSSRGPGINPSEIKNKLPGRIASGEFKLPDEIKVR